MGRVPEELVAEIDQIIADRVDAATLQASLKKQSFDYALQSQWMWLLDKSPDLYALCIMRLEDTGNDEMLAVADLAKADD